MFSYGKQDFAMRTSLLVVVLKPGGKLLALVLPCRMGGAVCTVVRVRAPGPKKGWNVAGKQIGSTADVQLMLYAKGKNQWR